MYPDGEIFTDLASVAFRKAMIDATMLEPTTLGTGLLFDPTIYDVRLGGDASMTGSNRQITVPISKIIITIGRPYGIEIGYGTVDPGSTFAEDVDLWVPFTTWTNTGASDDDAEKALLFARDHRQNVFSNFGLNLQVRGVFGARPRQSSPITGLDAVDYRWRFFYSRA